MLSMQTTTSSDYFGKIACSNKDIKNLWFNIRRYWKYIIQKKETVKDDRYVVLRYFKNWLWLFDIKSQEDKFKEVVGLQPPW